MSQHDPRHVDVLAQEHGLENGNTVQSTALHETMIDETETLDVTRTNRYRSEVARCSFLSEDRGEIMFTVKELRQSMSDPTHSKVSPS